MEKREHNIKIKAKTAGNLQDIEPREKYSENNDKRDASVALKVRKLYGVG